MPITTALLARLCSLDDLVELIRELGFVPRTEELATPARRRLGLDHPAILRAAIIGAHDQLTVYGLVAAEGRGAVIQAAESLARRGPATPSLVIALQPPGILAVAAAVSGPGELRARQLRVDLSHPSPVSAEILSGLGPRAGESGRELASRMLEVLREEGITARFFSELARRHDLVATELRDMPRASAEERRDMALVILTRVLFLYFVQAKGWLAGRNDFLPSLLDTALRRGHLFHRAVYEPLCFGALSAPLGARTGPARALGNVPFLNGGLFERHPLERRFPSASLPNEAWRAVIDELFGRFHFTLRENDDADAVDPEMLGRVFEGLMKQERRRASGTYFTPRDLLGGMVSDALAAALQGRTGAAAHTLRVLDPAVGSGAFLLEALRQLDHRAGPSLSRGEAVARRRDIVRDCLFGVDADPMAVRLAELRLWLALVVDDDATWDAVAPLPNLDRNLRQGDSLLSPFDVARAARLPSEPLLRAVAERRGEYFAATGRRKHELAASLRGDERRLATTAAQAELESLNARLADATAPSRDLFGGRVRRGARQQSLVDEWRRRRRELKLMMRRIDDDGALPFFAYEVHYADVVAAGGFDVVIGNPPWVRGERLTPTARGRLAERYHTFRPAANQGFAHLPDLSVAFVERALELARPGGIVALLLPAKLLRAGYAGALRAHLRSRATVLRLDDRSHAAASGFGATVFPLVCLLRNAVAAPREAVSVRVAVAGGELSGLTCAAELPLDPSQPRSPWLALPGDSMRHLRATLASGRSLAEVFHPRLGVKTGANEVFLRSAESAGDLPQSCRVPAVQGRDIAPFTVQSKTILLAAVDETGTPLRRVPDDVRRYLEPFRAKLSRRADAGDAPAWTLFRTELLRGRHLVVWRDIAPRLEAAVIDRTLPGSTVPLNTCYGVAVGDQVTAWWLCAWLNSTVIRSVAALIAERASGGCFRFSAHTVGTLPLPDPASPALTGLARIGRAATKGKEWTHDELDQLAGTALGGGRNSDAIRALGHALRGDAGGHCGPALSGIGGRRGDLAG